MEVEATLKLYQHCLTREEEQDEYQISGESDLDDASWLQEKYETPARDQTTLGSSPIYPS